MASPQTPNSNSNSQTYKTVYSPTFLTLIYDHYVLGFNMRYIWGCPTSTVLLPFFSDHFTRRHLDVGVATGYLPAAVLSRVYRATSPHFLTLLDISPNSLRAASARVAACAPGVSVSVVEADVTSPELLKSFSSCALSSVSGEEGRLYNSISMFNLLHCIPGGLRHKLAAIDNYAPLLDPTHGVLTGCTVLGEKHATGWLSRWYVRLYNRVGFFHNLEDTREGVEEALRRNFEEVETWLVGMTLLFRAAKPRVRDADLLV